MRDVTLFKIQQCVVAQISNAASFRERAADDYPEDDRNARSALWLTKLAEFVGDMQDEDRENFFRHLRPYYLEGYHDGGFGGFGSSESNHYLSRFGFDRDVKFSELNLAFVRLIHLMAEEEAGMR